MTRMIKAVNDGRLALCGWPGARFVWSLTASLGDLYCNPRLRRGKEKNLPPAEEEEVRPAWSPQVAPLMLLPSSHAVPLMELSARKGQTGYIIITLRWQFLVGNLGLGVTYQVHPVANKLHSQKSAVSNGLSPIRKLLFRRVLQSYCRVLKISPLRPWIGPVAALDRIACEFAVDEAQDA